MPAASGMGMMGGGMMGSHSIRHLYIMRHGLPSTYAGKKNPVPASEENLSKGQLLYSQICASCHGLAGRGDGAAAKGMDPPPADLTRTMSMPVSTDGYLYWSIEEGGTELKSAMPAMKGSLTSDDIWKLILYLRTL